MIKDWRRCYGFEDQSLLAVRTVYGPVRTCTDRYGPEKSKCPEFKNFYIFRKLARRPSFFSKGTKSNFARIRLKSAPKGSAALIFPTSISRKILSFRLRPRHQQDALETIYPLVCRSRDFIASFKRNLIFFKSGLRAFLGFFGLFSSFYLSNKKTEGIFWDPFSWRSGKSIVCTFFRTTVPYDRTACLAAVQPLSGILQESSVKFLLCFSFLDKKIHGVWPISF